MSTKQHVVLYTFAAAVLVAFTLSLPLAAQQSPQHIGIVDDWSTHHLGFSNPGSFQDAEASGTVDRWLRIVNDPRYQMQRMKQSAPPRQVSNGGVAPVETAGAGNGNARNKPKPLNLDWSVNMGSNATVGAGQYPAKFFFNTSQATCGNGTFPDYVVYNTGLAGSGTQATIVTYDNLYSGCTGTVPSIYWRYNTAYPQGSMTGDGSLATTSVVLSFDGGQIALVQHNSSSVASLVLLKWAPSTSLVQMNTASNNVTPANYRSCTAPCMTRITFNGSNNSTNSAPFYDYNQDVLYVGDDNGVLHKFQSVFFGTPSEVTTNWPVTVSTGNILTSPTLDSVTGNVFVGSTDGFLYRVASTGGAGIASAALGASNRNGATGIFDAPIVDSSAGTVYVFVANNGNGNCNGNDCRAEVVQLSTTFASGSSGLGTVTFNRAKTGNISYDGAFDNTYWNSPNQTGNLYVCAGQTPTLFQVPVTNNTITNGAVVTGPALVTGNSSLCSPVTEFFNSPNDRIFLSVTGSPTQSGCGNAGCIMSFNVTTAAGFGIGTTASAVATETSGTSAIIVDNAVSLPAGSSQVYFSPLANQTCTTSGGTGGCAIQASQAALQ